MFPLLYLKKLFLITRVSSEVNIYCILSSQLGLLRDNAAIHETRIIKFFRKIVAELFMI